MNLRDIREEVWAIARETGDTDETRLWPTNEMNMYINRTYRYLARETRCIRDAVTPSVCMVTIAPIDYLTLTPGTIDYIWANDPNSWLYQKTVTPLYIALNPLILEVEEGKWTYKQWKMRKVSVNKWQVNPWWEQVTGTMATEFATDYSSNTVAFNYRSEATDIFRMVVKRMPLVDLIYDTDIPEIRVQYHDFMKHGILWQMYSKQDTQTIDVAKAADYYKQFLLDVDEVKQQESMIERKLNVSYSMDGFR